MELSGSEAQVAVRGEIIDFSFSAALTFAFASLAGQIVLSFTIIYGLFMCFNKICNDVFSSFYST